MDYGKMTYNCFRLLNENKNSDGSFMTKHEDLDAKEKEKWSAVANYIIKLSLLQKEFEGMIIPLENKLKEFDEKKQNDTKE